MKSIERLISNLERVKENLIEITLEVLDEHETQIRELIHVQLNKGQRGDGQLITPQYSSPYAKKKKRTVPDLRVSGKFWSDIYTEISGNILKVQADTQTSKGFELAEHLEKRYTSKIYELTKESQKKLREIILEELFKKINDEISK